eukprot:7388524-Prymnesium_polylepis.3
MIDDLNCCAGARDGMPADARDVALIESPPSPEAMEEPAAERQPSNVQRWLLGLIAVSFMIEVTQCGHVSSEF